jgi:hypothetical protein
LCTYFRTHQVTRNQCVFQQIKPHLVKVLQAAFWNASPIVNTICHSSDQPKINWKPPDADHVKLNFDGSVKCNDFAAGSFVIKDSHGSLLISGANNLGLNGVLQAKGLGLSAGLHAAFLAEHKKNTYQL